MTYKEIVCYLIDHDDNIKETCIDLGISRDKIYKACSACNYPVNVTASEIIRMQNNGHSIDEICNKLGMSRKNVQRYTYPEKSQYGLPDDECTKDALKSRKYREKRNK